MTTNREKINKMSNEEFAEKFNTRGENCEVCAYWDKGRNFCNSNGRDGRNGDDCRKGFIDWLSQEAEEDTQEEIHLTMPEDENTRKVIEYIIPRLTSLSARLDKLEEEGKTKDLKDFAINDIQPSGYSYGSIKNGKTADQMFEELGYKIDDEQEDGSIQFTKKGNIESDDFEISIIDIQKKNGEWVFYKMQDYDLEGITEAEDKAIHKKIEELKNE